MKIVYAHEPTPTEMNKSIFLGGCTPRSDSVISWRDEAIEILEKLNYDGVVFIPEPRDKIWSEDYEGQLEWEDKHLNIADCILFWIPRDLKEMPGFTSNDEWGFWKNSGKVVFGAPPDAVKVRYQQHYAEKFKVPFSDSLEETIQLAIDMIGPGAMRYGGECQVPYYIWKTPSFQQWYKSQVAVGNRLDGASVHWTYRAGPKKDFMFLWILHVNIYVASEDRNKVNEFVIARTDISSVVVYKRRETIEDSEIVIVKEFRSPASNETGFIWEVPGGSSPKPNENPLQIASDEVHEETGFNINAERFKAHAPRQLAATFSAHKAHLFSVEISEEELEWFKSQKDIVHGNVSDSERTFVEIFSFREILSNPQFDWSTVGMIYSILSDI